MAKQRNSAPAGPGVDAAGNAVRDPTANVLDLVDAAIRRQDDLREMQVRYTELLAQVRGEHAHEVSELRHKYEAEVRAVETARLNAIRQVDQANVQHAAEVQQGAAASLAAQVATTADAFRAALTAALDPIMKDIADLRKTQYEQAGQKAQVSETREVRGETRLNLGTVLGALSVLLVLVGMYLAR